MHFRELQPEDSAAIAAIWRTGAEESGMRDPAFRPRISVAAYGERVRADLAASKVFGWAAFATPAHEEPLCGYLTAEIREPSVEWAQDRILYVLDVDVAPAWRGRGIAKALVNLAVERAVSLGISRLELSWIANDPRSSEVWARLGFREYLVRGYLLVKTR